MGGKILSTLRLQEVYLKFRTRICVFILICSLLVTQFSPIFVTSVHAATSPWTQTDWSGGSGQTSWSDNTKFDSSSNITTSTAGQATLTNTEKLSNTGFESDLTGWSGSQSYTLQDEFTTDRAAGSVNGTAAEPTGGTRTVTDTNSKLSISGSQLSFATGGSAAGNPGLWYPLQTRVAGKILSGTVTPSGTNDVDIGWDSAQAGNIREGQFVASGTGLRVRIAGNSINTGTTVSGTPYQFVSVLRSTGMYYFIRGGTFTNWTLLYVSSTSAGDMYPGMAGSTTGVGTVDNIHIPTTTWLPTPLAYDTFTRSDGAIGNSETTGPDSQSTPSLSWTGGAISGNNNVITPALGSDLAVNGGFGTDTNWTKDASWSIGGGVATKVASAGSEDIDAAVAPATVGTWYQIVWDLARTAGTFNVKLGGNAQTSNRVISGTYTDTNRAINNGGLGIRGNASGAGTVDNVSLKALTLSSLFSSVSTSDSDVIADANVTLTAGTQAGLVLNLDSTSSPANFVIAYHDGINVKLDKNVGGTYTNLISAAVTYSAGATLRVTKDGTKYRVYYNNALVGSEQTISDAGIISNTNHGVFSTYSGNSFDNFTLWPRGTGGEYADIPAEDLTVTRDTATTYSSSAGSAKLVSAGNNANFLQSVNVGDTNSYNLSTYAYTNGSAVTSSDLELYYNGSTISTTYASVGGGWYKLSGTLTGANASRDYGVRVKAGKTVYMDNFSLNRYEASGTLTSSIFDTEFSGGAVWGILTYSSSGSTVVVKARSGSSSSMSGATDFSSCTGVTSGSDISSNSCVTDSHRYIQYQLALSTSDTLSTPTFSDISIAFETADADGPILSLDSPGDNSYTNNERPTFKWKQASDAISSIADYDFTIDNPSAGASEPSGDFTITDIPISRTTDYEANKHFVHYENFSDADANNNYLALYTKSHSDWSTSELDGKLREGKVSWRVKATDSAGNYTESTRTLFVDRTSPNVELTQVNNTPFSSTNFSTTDKTPTIFGKITDPLSGGDPSLTQDENGPKVAAGPKQVVIKIEKKEGLFYKLHTLYTMNMDKPWWSCDGKEVTDNTKQKCDKYLPFEYTPNENLDYGTYKITLTGRDKADNASGETILTLNITTFTQIITPEEQKQVKEEVEITRPTEVQEPNIVEKAGERVVETSVDIFARLRNLITSIFRGIGYGIQLAITGTRSGLAYLVGRAKQDIAAIGSAYNFLAQNAPGAIGDVMASIGEGIGNGASFIAGISNKALTGIKNGVASLAFAAGEKAQGVSDTLGFAFVKFGYLFVNEPTGIYDVEVAVLSPTSAKISWQTNHPANGKVNYGPDKTYPFDEQSEKRVTHHEFTLTDLQPATLYYFEVMSQNKNYVYDANREFKTPSQ